MPAANPQVTTKQVLTTARSEAEQLLTAAFNNLKDVLKTAATGETPRLFFPNGIEIIYVKVDVFLTDKIRGSVELKIAGEKGLKTLEVESGGKVSALAG